jgi:integrase
MVAIFCGLRASELRGLRWLDIDFEVRQISVAQRADASHRIGKLNFQGRLPFDPLPAHRAQRPSGMEAGLPEARYRQVGRER